jgi:hypothetical protein
MTAMNQLPRTVRLLMRLMKQWEHSGSCYRRMEGGQNLSPNLALPRELENPSIRHVFEYIKKVLLLATNHQLEGEEVTYREFLALPRELENPLILHVFEILFFHSTLEKNLLVATNHQLEGEEVTYGEFLALPRELENPSILHVAAIFPDSVFGCLPLHYAVANGANVNVNYVLLQAYPLSKHVDELFLVHQMVLLVLIKGSMVAVQRCEHWPISCSLCVF